MLKEATGEGGGGDKGRRTPRRGAGGPRKRAKSKGKGGGKFSKLSSCDMDADEGGYVDAVDCDYGEEPDTMSEVWVEPEPVYQEEDEPYDEPPVKPKVAPRAEVASAPGPALLKRE